MLHIQFIYFTSLRTPCITLRPETEWIETVESGMNTIVGSNRELIVEAINEDGFPAKHPEFYGNGMTAKKIGKIIKEMLD